MTGQKLQEAVAWAEGKSLSDEEHRFIGAGRRLEQKAAEDALKAEMQEKEIHARKKENRMLGAFLIIALIIGGFAFWQWNQTRIHKNQAEKQAVIAEKQKELALEAINTLTYKLVDELVKIPRTMNIVTRILESNTQLLDRIYELDPDTKKAMREKSVNLNRLGDTWLLLGNTAAALNAYENALEISRKLAIKDPDNTEAQRDLLVSHYKFGKVYEKLNKPKEALEEYQKALAIAQELAKDKINKQAQDDLETLQDLVKGLADD